VPREIPSRRLAGELLVDSVEVALDRGEIGACLIDVARGERVFGVVGMPVACPLLVSIRLVLHMPGRTQIASALGA
jgi:hypothetical protein